jgi:glycosyltransferase involved in cell wall biosynthesis
MATISVCMIVRDEEKNLGRCLESVKGLADEIIVVDTGSKDRTREIAKRYTRKVFDFRWMNDFSKARNFSISKARGKWIFMLDADEVVSERDVSKIRGLARNRHFDGFSFLSRTYTNNDLTVNFIALEKDKYPESKGYKGYDKSRAIRMFRRDDRIFYEGEVHELVEHSIKRKGGKIAEVSIPVHHFGERTVNKDDKYLELGRERVSSRNDPKAHFSLAFSLFRKGDYKGAVTGYKKAIELEPDYRDAWFGLSEVLAKQGRYQEAVKVNRRIVDKWPSESAGHYNLGELLLALGRKREAVECYQRALELGSPKRERIVGILSELKER